MSQLERDASSSVVVQYRVNTPLYATRLVADYLCVPLDARLKASVLGAYQGLGRQMRFGLGTAAHAWPAVFLSVMVCAVLGSAVLVTLVGQASWLPSLIAAPSIPMLLFAIACYSFWFAIAGKVPNIYFKFFPATFSVSALLGVVFLLGSVIAACLVAVNWPIYGVVANTTKVTSHAFWSSNVLPVSAGLATLTTTFAGLAFDVMRRIVASASVSAVEESLAINENGGVSVVPLHRAVRFLAPGVVLGCMVWTAASIWIVFTLINLNRFVVAYTGATWYFSDPATCGCDQRDVGWCPALIALEIGLKHHLGSMALGALGLPLTVVKSAFAFLSRRLNPQYFDVDAMEVPPGVPDASNHATDTMARSLDALVDPIADVVDSTTTAVWTEIALQCHNLNGGIRSSRARLLCKGPRVMPSIASPYVGTAGIQSLTMACAAALGAYFMGFLLLTNVSDFDIRQLARDSGIRTTHKAFFDFTSPDSSRFVSSPAYAAGIGAVMAFLFVLMIAETVEVISDSMFYCYILESDGYGETYHGTRIGNVVDHPCNMRYAPAGVKQFLSEVLEVEEMEDNAYVN
ncbi:MAG: hypothetical protein KVP17_003555 [Porospora cf. gigantea B]|uniref:uncharacterized protein n=1 Tax=Porospora cf. gigantea B TaxID=2853592 RepID=UPI00357194C8|nr:MAG: hypothetical protein KVP17_003555 [Porospora cf. gigantea B]